MIESYVTSEKKFDSVKQNIKKNENTKKIKLFALNIDISMSAMDSLENNIQLAKSYSIGRKKYASIKSNIEAIGVLQK
jgi:predicted patatin/cPLA2 family phospholipase